jgi:uncharacterized protein
MSANPPAYPIREKLDFSDNQPPFLFAHGILMVVFILGFAISARIQAASFDCENAQTKVETLVCKHGELSRLDDQLATTYRNALRAAADPIALRAEQREWLAERNRCTDKACLYKAYVRRVGQVFYYSQRDSDGKNQYKIVDDSCEPINVQRNEAGRKRCEVCTAYLEVLNAQPEPVQCDIPTVPESGFHPVEMKPIDPWAEPKLLYALDTFQRPNKPVELPGTRGTTRYKDMSFEQWLWAYKQESTDPRYPITPTLVEADMDLNDNGNLERVLGYTVSPHGCQSNVEQGYTAPGGRYHLFIRSDSPPGFDVQAARQMWPALLFTPMRHKDRIYLGKSHWEPPDFLHRTSDVQLFITWGLPIHATLYCRFEMPLSKIKDNQGEGL